MVSTPMNSMRDSQHTYIRNIPYVSDIWDGHNRDISYTVLTNTVNLESTDSRQLDPKCTIVLKFKVTATTSWTPVVPTHGI